MPLSPGAMVGPYEIGGRLGAGGMGEVWRARDSRLDRDVAIKALPAQFASDAVRLGRFDREARVLAALSHPHIASIYGIEESAAERYLILEFVDGESLAQRLTRGAIPLDEALAIARQICDALEAAHGRGIIHRDLKPANIMLTRDGQVKVLDFGLARVVEQESAADQANSPTLTALATQAGVILGTAAYMAPEQVKGKRVDTRADIWAFGAVLFEMLTGQRAFEGDDVPTTLASILKTEPAWEALLPGTAIDLQRLLSRCLNKDPKERLQAIGDARIEIRELLDRSEGPPATAPVRRATSRWGWAASGAVLAGVGGLALAVGLGLGRLWGSSPSADHARLRVNVDLGPDAASTADLGTAISPDGRRLVWTVHSASGTSQLATRLLDQASTTTLDGTSGAASPFFSPDGQWIGFLAGDQLKKVTAHGGPVVTIATIPSTSLSASWGDNQDIVLTSGSITPLMHVSATGGKPEALLTKPGTRLGEEGDATHRWPQVLPGGRGVLFTSHKIVAGFDDATIEVWVAATGERRVLVRGGYYGRYVGTAAQDGYLLYVREGVLFAVQFDIDSLTVRGVAVPVLDDIAGDADIGAGLFDATGLAAQGPLIYRSGKGPARKWPLLWLDRSGKTEPLLADPAAYYTFRLSPDGLRLAMTVDQGARGREIAVYDIQRGTISRLTSTGEVNLFPLWSPDGKYIVFESSSPKGYGLGAVRADGGGTLHRLGENNSLMIPYSFTSDGRLVYSASGIWVARLDTTDLDNPRLQDPQRLARGVGGGAPAVSPDGHWLAYRSAESGRDQVYVQPFPDGGAKVQVSTDGEGYSGFAWASGVHELYWVSSDHRIMAAEYQVTNNLFVPGKPHVVTDTQVGVTMFPNNFSVSPDGKRFVVLGPRNATIPPGSVHLAFFSNFSDELRDRVGPRR
jgi:serine/threonine-protein kinase